ncbi:MAG: LysR family transcriptional regulator, partial [Pseudomonadota bacterium]|nr:LysR family transcriptional regulator [Pseudomonadota bacterium]
MPKLILKLDFKGYRLGPGKIALLKAIIETGSISAAAKTMDMSYRRAWALINELNNMFTKPCVESATGGVGGGGATVTEFGKRLIAAYSKLEKQFAKAA